MNKLVIIFILLVLPGAVFALEQPENCKVLYQEIENDIAKSNYCVQDNDCDILELGGRMVKFGCYHFVNKVTDKDVIYKKMLTYYNQCYKLINDCSPSPRPVCVKNKCVEAQEKSE